MKPETPEWGDSLPLSVAERIDEVCTRFEAAWQNGQPRLEEFLGAAEGSEREALLRELLRVELDYRCQDGSVPAVEQYRGRFPGCEPLLRVEGSAGRTGPYAGGPDTEPVVSGYEIRGPLGQGGMAQVWRGHDPDLDRPIALKVMRAELCRYPEAESRFLDEAR